MSPSWVKQALDLLDEGPCVLVTLRRHKGSAPRESGARMIVNESEFRGSIGGGNLEYQAIAAARKMLTHHGHPGSANRAQDRHPGNAKSAGESRCDGRTEGPELAGEAVARVVRDPPAGTAPPTEPVGPGQRLRRFRDDDSKQPRLQDDEAKLRREPYGLGPALNQCCGGAVEVLYEYLSSPAPDWLTALANAADQGDPAVLATAVDGESPRHYVALPVGRESALSESLRLPVRKILDDAGHASIEVISSEGETWWLERIAADKRRLLLFGAGHVGKAVVKTLADLPFEVRWLDSRGEEFPEDIPGNVTVMKTDDPLAEVSGAAPDTTFIVMTHSHDLDEDICHAVLERGDFAFLALIGSVSKRRRFVHRLARRGIDEKALERLVCPIGLPDIRGKEPATIALSLAAQLMSEPREENRSGST